ncbi:MAG: hypothetical protein ABR540_08890 [Acidimicrobiales bacterium]
MATNPPPDLILTPINGAGRPVTGWLTTFHLLFVALDPGNQRSTWIVPTAARILTDYEQADCRVAWLVAGAPEDARRLLGRWAREILTFVDPELTAIRAFGLESLPAAVHLGMDGTVVNAVEGWDPAGWRTLTVELSKIVDWSHPVIPGPQDPAPFEGAPLPQV